MAFSKNTILQVWERSGSKCECKHTGHSHHGRCGSQLSFENRGKQINTGWQAFHIGATFDNSLYNCEVICWECQKHTTKPQ